MAKSTRERPSVKERAKSALLGSALGRAALVVPRAVMAFREARLGSQAGAILRWSLNSRERVNFTYQTTRHSDLLLCAVVAEAAGVEASRVVAWLDELYADTELIAFIDTVARAKKSRHRIDPGFKPGRRLAFYLLVRALKPRHVVEAGVDRGLGALVISRALALNAAEGHPGAYTGIEYSPTKPIPLWEDYPERIGRIVRGDSIEFLDAGTEPIDLFVHDTTSDDTHVETQLHALTPRLSQRGVIASTWTTDRVVEHALAHNLSLLTHQEEPVGHWFKGDRVAILYPRKSRTAVSPGTSIWPRLASR